MGCGMQIKGWLCFSGLAMSLDFACLQETHVVSLDECNSWFSSHGFLSVASPGSPHSCGPVILYHPCYTLVNTWNNDNGRFVLAEFERRNVTFRVVCLYAPNRNPDRDDFFASCCSSIDPSFPTLICGDFNSVPDRAMDRRGSNIWDVSRESTVALLSLSRLWCHRYLEVSSPLHHCLYLA